MPPACHRWYLVAVLIAIVHPASTSASEEFDDAAFDYFETQVRPILVARCNECHGPEVAEPKGGLRIDSRRALLTGGDTGPAVKPGSTKDSLLIDSINYGDVYQMPPRSKLPAAEIALLTRWVEMGAPWPADNGRFRTGKLDFNLAQRRSAHWAWQPIHEQTPPAVKTEAWPAGPIDRFTLAGLEAKGLEPARDAVSRTMVRRLYFDLVGLPPEPVEVEQFVADNSPGAYDRLVDRLLESPHFGERWGRHWLDLVRYGESRGHEFDPVIPNAWQYRDYVIRALNADVPYDQFLKEHIAGDLLPCPRLNPKAGFNESILGTGFWFLGEEVHSPVDVRLDETDRIDNRLDVMCKTFLGLTVACARCHDHKFDAISQRDYYALSGYLISSSYRQVRFETLEQERPLAERLERLREEMRESILKQASHSLRPGLNQLSEYLLAAREAILDANSSEKPAVAVANLPSLQPAILAAWMAELSLARSATAHPLHAFALAVYDRQADEPTRMAQILQVVVGRMQKPTSGADASTSTGQVVVDYGQSKPAFWSQNGFAFGSRPVQPGDLQLANHEGHPSVQVLDYGEARFDPAWSKIKPPAGQERDHGKLGEWARSGQTLRTPEFQLASNGLWYLVRGSGRAYAAVNSHLVVAGPLHAAVLKEWKGKPDEWQWVRHDMAAYSGHRLHVEFSPHDDHDFALAKVVDSATSPGQIERANGLLLDLLRDPKIMSPEDLARAYQRLLSDVVQTLAADRIRLSADGLDRAALANWLLQHPNLFSLPESEPRAQLDRLLEQLAAKEAAIIAQIPAESRTAPAMFDGSGMDELLLIRGSPKTPGAAVPRRMIEAIAGTQQPPPTSGSGRLELAARLLDPNNPFTSRVLVNRVWHHLFGRGIVATVDNFGVLGQPPTHPELLDYLAAEFVREGWSMKRLIRTLVSSRTYRMSSLPDARGDNLDPQNLLLHRMAVRRLEGEAVRDAILSVSGRLDRTHFGPSVPVHLTPFMQGRGRPQSGPLDGAGRRSVYLSVRRNFLSPMMLAFDMPIPFSSVGRRNVSNVPAQALILMNDPFVVEQAELWARRVLADPKRSAEERVTDIYLAAFARLPSEQELAVALEFLQQQAKELRLPPDGWQSHVQVWRDLCHVMINSKEFIYVG